MILTFIETLWLLNGEWTKLRIPSEVGDEQNSSRNFSCGLLPTTEVRHDHPCSLSLKESDLFPQILSHRVQICKSKLLSQRIGNHSNTAYKLSVFSAAL